jgi:acetoin utilization protein AcuB
MQIREVMTDRVQQFGPEANLAAVIEIMGNNDCDELLIVEDGRLVGVVTQRDICLALGTRNCAARDVVVRDVGITVVQTCDPGDDIYVAMDFMRTTRVRIVPVVDKKGMLQGSVTLSDLVHRIEREPGATRWEKLVETLTVIGGYPIGKLAAEIETKLARTAA